MTAVSYTSLEPSYSQTLSQDGRPLSFSTSNAVSLFTSTSFLWSAGIMICVVAAGFMYMRAGALRMQASEAGVRKSNEEIKRTTIGLIGVLSLFVILYTFNKGLLRGDVSLISLKASPYGGSSATVATGGTTAGAGAEDVSTGGSGGTEEANRKTLGDAGIGINNAACADSSSRGCTNVGNINSASIAILLKLKSECGCSILVTGGSEPNGHSATSNHGPGKEALDIQFDAQLETFLKSKSVVGNTSPCNIKYGYSGFIFWDEPASGCGESTARHFHASFTGR
jgi:hypothetical protein